MIPAVVIVGSNSMLGLAVARHFAAQGYRVLGCGRSGDVNLKLDLEAESLTAVPEGLSAELLIHCAAAFGDDSWEGCRLNEQVNSVGSYLVAELAAKLKCQRVLYAGSIFSSEDDPFRITSYASSKLRAEAILDWSLSRSGIGFASLRLPQLYDEKGRCCRHQPWFGRIVAYASRGKLLRMPGGEALRNFMHIDDAARLFAAASEKQIEGRLDLSSPESLSCHAIARLANSVFANGGRYEIDAQKQEFREIFIPDSRAAFQLLGCQPVITMREGLRRIKEQGDARNFGPLDVQ